MTNFWNHVSLVHSYYDMVDPSAVLAYMLVNHIREACCVIFSMHFFISERRKFMGQMKITPDKKNIEFFSSFHFLKKISQNIELEVLCFIWLANNIKMSVRFKFHQNPMKSIVLTEFWMFLLEKNLTLKQKISSI